VYIKEKKSRLWRGVPVKSKEPEFPTMERGRLEKVIRGLKIDLQ